MDLSEASVAEQGDQVPVAAVIIGVPAGRLPNRLDDLAVTEAFSPGKQVGNPQPSHQSPDSCHAIRLPHLRLEYHIHG